ncbi:MAG: sigma-54 dependent transcriptional regulator [Desulfobulbaceae bacterium]|jgi:two-component system NtrC family response regulator|nr:sigma-54 dependent transcriptional regulator [Desulfobulbaceae bacterium]MDY0351547.1 sigma-54 dependent transcriptional regulator [Desulfobulbaceae bacterium]
MAAHILVVDDDQQLCGMLVEHLRRSGYEAVGVNTLRDGIKLARSHVCDVIFLDVQMPDGNGLDHLSRFKNVPSAPEVIIITGKGDPNGAQQAISSGAWSYIEKPHVVRDLLLHLTRALQYREEKKRIKTVPVALKRDNIIGSSPQIKVCLDQTAKAAGCDASVLITGETGTGKEIFARAIHENSHRAGGRFVVVDCATMPENLIESTLFGYTKGAFTGADLSRDGLIKHADGGTLFLDEIGELPLSMQKAFLRVLQEHSYRPVGGTTEMKSNFRVIAATNRDLTERVQNGNFRSDLFFRLQGIRIELPPLRERIEDIKELTIHYVEQLCGRYGLQSKGIAPDFIGALSTYHWPGNVRELFQVLEHVLAQAADHPTLFARHLPDHLRVLQAQAGIQASPGGGPAAPAPQAGNTFLPWREYKRHLEKSYIRDLLLHAGGNVTKACRTSGLSRTRLYQLMKKYGISF